MYSSQRKQWLAHPGMPDELKEMMLRMDAEEANDCFYRDLAFGTGGLRGVLGPGSNRMNVYTVYQATRGLGRYILFSSRNPACAVSYDSRIHSRDFAELTAAALAEMGIRVYLYPQLMPTPMLSYAVRYLECTAGVMITASHNPAKFNGYKVYGPDGCQITLEAANTIQELIGKEKILVERLPDFPAALEAGMVTYITDDLVESYYQMINSLRIHPVDTRIHVVYSPLNGTGNVPVREMLRRHGNVDLEIVEEQEKPDGNFPTAPYPNPEIREAMELAIRKTVETKADFCFATDPDCDRLGAGVRCGDEVQLISGNDMGILLLDYILSHRRTDAGSLPPVVVKTIVSTDMAAAVCSHYGAELRNVLTGFKFIGEQIGLLEKEGHVERYAFGFEESYGYLSGTSVRDKDAVNAALLVCEMAANLKAEGKTMLDRLSELRETYGYYAQRLLTFAYEGEAGAQTMERIMQGLRMPVDDQKEVLWHGAEMIDYLHDETGLPKSDVLSFRLSDGRKIIVRPSGTEPKLKAYLFASDVSQEKAEKRLDDLERITRERCTA